MSSFRSSLTRLFTPNRKRNERLKSLRQILDHGTEDDYLELLKGWGIPAANLESLLNEFRRHRREKRGSLL